MPRVPDASTFTRFQLINAQSLAPTGKPTQSSVASATKTLNGTIGSIAKASAVAASAAPKTSVAGTSTLKGNTSKRG